MELINDNMQQDLSEDIPECRICFDPEAEDDMLLNPCLCNGTSKYVHMSCLTRWRAINADRPAYIKCMECNYNYNIKIDAFETLFRFMSFMRRSNTMNI